MSESLAQAVTRRPVTSLLAVAAIGATFWGWQGDNLHLLTLDARAWSREPWRLVSSVLPHGDLIHLAFNLYWLVVFGRLVEPEFGSKWTALILLYLAAGSSLAQYAFSYPGIGLSGVGYGLFGLLWVLNRGQGRLSGALPPKVTLLFVAWFVLCIILSEAGVWSVGNVAHGAGALLGGLLGWAVEAETARARETRRLILVLVLVGLGGVAVFGRPFVNFTDAVPFEAAQLGHAALVAKRNREAVWHLERATQSIQDVGTWYNLGIAYEWTSQFDKAKAAYEHAVELDPLDEFSKEALEHLQTRMNPAAKAEGQATPLGEK